MVDRDIVLAKIASIRRHLERIQVTTQGKPESLDLMDTQDLFVLNLQRAVQAAIDLAAHIVADEKLGLPESLKEHFVLLETAQIIQPSLCRRLQAMVGFRNIAVHDYERFDVNILKALLQQHLVDLEEFTKAVAALSSRLNAATLPISDLRADNARFVIMGVRNEQSPPAAVCSLSVCYQQDKGLALPSIIQAGKFEMSNLQETAFQPPLPQCAKVRTAGAAPGEMWRGPKAPSTRRVESLRYVTRGFATEIWPTGAPAS